jgi:hypothetical protein
MSDVVIRPMRVPDESPARPSRPVDEWPRACHRGWREPAPTPRNERARSELGTRSTRLATAFDELQSARDLSRFTFDPISSILHLKSLRVFCVKLQQLDEHPGFSF